MKSWFLFVFLFLLSARVFSFSYTVNRISIPEGYIRMSFNDGILCVVRSKPASVLVFDENGNFLSELTLNLSYPVNAVHVAGMVYVSDYYRSAVMVYTIQGAFLKRIDVGKYPTTLKVYRESVYVACSFDSSVYQINIWTNSIVEKVNFDVSTLYFEVLEDGIVYLYYFDDSKTFEIRNKSRRETIVLNNLKNPLKYYKTVEGEYLLGYSDGILVRLNNNKEVWRVNLPDFARDFVVSRDFIAVTSLLEPVISLVSHDGKLLKQIRLPNATHRILFLNNTIVALNHLPGQVYFVNPMNDKVETVDVGEYAIEMVRTSQNGFVVLCSDSGDLYFFSVNEG